MRLFKFYICVVMTWFFMYYPSVNFTADIGVIISTIWMLGAVFYMGPES